MTRQPSSQTTAGTPGEAVFAPLQRKCACGSSAAGPGGECEACRQENACGLQARLAVSARDDPFEREADRAAAQVMGTTQGAHPRLGPTPPRISRRPAAADAGGRRAAPAGVADTLRRPGEPLPASARAFFEPRFGHDFSRVRIHRDPAAAASARAVAARAYTVGRHVVFAAGRYAPDTRRGRVLLAHELAHVIQQDAAGASGAHLQRMPDDTDREQEQPSGQQWVTLEVTTDPSNADQNEFKALDEETPVDFGTVYPGDVLSIRRFAGDMGEPSTPATWSLPGGLERVGSADGGDALQLRVSGGATAGRTLSIGLTDDAGIAYRLTLQVGRLPGRPQAVNPEFARLQQARQALRTQRREARHRARGERKAGRGASPAERRAQRTRRRQERRMLRRQARALRRETRGLRRSESCSLSTQRDIQTALERAIAVVGTALSRLRGADALGAPDVANALGRFMRWTPSDTQGEESARHLARIVDTLTVARNSMLLAVHGDFECTLDCDETTGAAVTQGSRRRSAADSGVSVCPAWITGRNLRFDVVRGVDSARAYALLHEFVHKSGAFAHEEDRLYVGRSDWQSVTAREALGLADGYAALAWTLANGGVQP